MPIFRYIHKIVKRNYWLCLSVRLPVWNSLAPTGWIFMKFVLLFFENLYRKFKLH